MVEIGTPFLKLTIASLMILVCILNSEKSYLSLFYPTYYIISRVHISNNEGPPFLLSMTAFHAHFSLINLYKHAPVIIFILSIFITHFFQSLSNLKPTYIFAHTLVYNSLISLYISFKFCQCFSYAAFECT